MIYAIHFLYEDGKKDKIPPTVAISSERPIHTRERIDLRLSSEKMSELPGWVGAKTAKGLWEVVSVTHKVGDMESTILDVKSVSE